MKLSPVQLINSQFVKISVEFKDERTAEAIDSSTKELDIEHMTHIMRHSSAPPEEGGDPDLGYYMLALGIRSSRDNENELPYEFEIVVTAVVSVDPKQFPPDNNCDDSAAKFGFSILYGQIREMLTMLTGRMIADQFVLPTMSFMDEKFPVAEPRE